MLRKLIHRSRCGGRCGQSVLHRGKGGGRRNQVHRIGRPQVLL